MTWNESNLIPDKKWNKRHQKIASTISPLIKYFHDFGCGKQYISEFLDSKTLYCGYDKFQYHPNSIVVDLDSSKIELLYAFCKTTDRRLTALCFEGVLEYLQDPLKTLANILELYQNPRQVVLSVHSLQIQTLASKLRIKLLRTLKPQLVYDKSNINIQLVSYVLFSRGYIMNEWLVDAETNIVSFLSTDLI